MKSIRNTYLQVCNMFVCVCVCVFVVLCVRVGVRDLFVRKHWLFASVVQTLVVCIFARSLPFDTNVHSTGSTLSLFVIERKR